MTFSESITTCFKKYVDFNGRASRSEFWYFYLFLTIIGVAIIPLDIAIFPFNEWGPIGTTFAILTFFPYIAVTARRLHDSNYSGWLQLLVITIIGIIPILIWLIQKGQEDEKFNPNGALKNIAGIFSKNKNILGMMPHPERMIDKYLSSNDGNFFFENLIENLK